MRSMTMTWQCHCERCHNTWVTHILRRKCMYCAAPILREVRHFAREYTVWSITYGQALLGEPDLYEGSGTVNG